MEKGQQVDVNGEVKWGDEYYSVSTTGTVEEWKKGAYALVTLECVDGDFGVCTFVKKKYISELADAV